MGIFIIDIVLHLVSFGRLYLREPHALLDLVAISGNLTFLVIHLCSTKEDQQINEHPMQVIYGILRLIHAYLIFRKLDDLTQGIRTIHRV